MLTPNLIAVGTMTGYGVIQNTAAVPSDGERTQHSVLVEGGALMINTDRTTYILEYRQQAPKDGGMAFENCFVYAGSYRRFREEYGAAATPSRHLLPDVLYQVYLHPPTGFFSILLQKAPSVASALSLDWRSFFDLWGASSPEGYQLTIRAAQAGGFTWVIASPDGDTYATGETAVPGSVFATPYSAAVAAETFYTWHYASGEIRKQG